VPAADAPRSTFDEELLLWLGHQPAEVRAADAARIREIAAEFARGFDALSRVERAVHDQLANRIAHDVRAVSARLQWGRLGSRRSRDPLAGGAWCPPPVPFAHQPTRTRAASCALVPHV
jgi:hypothetical protein